MNPCESLRLATAPYYREARVTFAWRRTACGMRHCFARRIVETGGRRELLRTSTRWVERHPQGVCRIRKASEPPTAAQQRMIEAEANRIATATRLRRAMAVQSASIPALRAARLQCQAFLLGFQRGDSLLRKRIPPLIRAAPAALQCPLAPNGRDLIPPNRFGDRISKNPKSFLFDSFALQGL